MQIRLGLALAPVAAMFVISPTAHAQTIAGQYIVVLKRSADTSSVSRAENRVRSHGGRVGKKFGSALKGFSAKFDKDALAAVKADPAVDFVEADQVVKLATTQTGAPWNLDRIDQHAPTLDGTYNYGATGAGVTA